jgi:ureidoacrylate peracid hydrolase
MPHSFTMPRHIVERVVARRGRAHVFDRLDPTKTALVVVDLQNAFMLPGVAHTLCEMAPSIVPNVNRLADALRRAGGVVAWVRTTATPETRQSWSHYYDDLSTREMANKRAAALAEGSTGHAFWSELTIAPDDMIATKLRYSAFMPGTCDLPERLRARGIDTVLITGTVTNVCCESSARDAMMLNFRTVMVSDGNAAATDDLHAASLVAFYLNFGDVLTTDQVIAGLRVGAPAREAERV